MVLEARVKCVLSGDTVVLSHLQNPSQERTLSLVYVTATRMRREGDEPFAFQSREFLRQLLVGRVVQFQVLYTIPTSNREYGLVILPNSPGPKTLPELCIMEGWVRIREDIGRREHSEETAAYLEKLCALEATARAESKGVWAESGDKIHAVYELPDPQAMVEKFHQQPIEGIVEKVLSGDRLIVRLLTSPTDHIQTLLLVAGVRAPTTKRTNPDGTEVPGEPLGDQAQLFVELRLLQRRVQITLLGLSPQNQLVGTVLHTNGNIAKFILEAGLARCSDHHSTLLGAEMASLRAAEAAAKNARKGLFVGHVGPKNRQAESEYTVSRVFSADTLYLRDKAGQEKRIQLSSVRQPKPSDPKQAPFVPEAKEYLRKKLIGKHVRVKIDGKKPASEGFEERDVATVIFGNENIALNLIQNGLASVIRHRRDDDDRSPEYDTYLQAEAEAQKAKKGMWADKPPKARQIIDYSESLQKAKIQASVLQRQKRVPGVVDFVKSGSRFAILLPRENAKLTFVLSGIRAPRSARNANDASEPFGNEAHELANRRCLQRDVEIDVETTDKVGGFIGTLYINREDFAKVLLEEGLAKVHAYSAEQSGHAQEYFAAEQRAKDARRGLWFDWDPSQDVEEEAEYTEPAADAPEVLRATDYRDIVVTNVDADGKLKVQQIGSGTSALTEMMSAFRNFHLNNANDKLPGPPKAGDFVSARFTEDNEWYRAKVRRNDRDNQTSDVFYIDFGNQETIPWTRLRPLAPQFSAQKLKPQASDAVLSLVQFPSTAEYLSDATNFLGDVVFG
ncbi:heat shock protein 90, partial [Ascosphaera pollenicola]